MGLDDRDVAGISAVVSLDYCRYSFYILLGIRSRGRVQCPSIGIDTPVLVTTAPACYLCLGKYINIWLGNLGTSIGF